MTIEEPPAAPPATSRTLDFDAFLAEQKKVPVVLLFRGKEYDLGPEMPAAIALDVIQQRALHGSAGAIPPQKLEELLRGVLGEHYQAVVVESRLGLESMGVLIVEVFKMFNPPRNRGEKREKAKRRKRST